MSDEFTWREIWSGRQDLDEPAHGGRWHQVVQPFSENSTGGTTLIGFAVDEGVRRNEGRVGAAQGPSAFRRCMRQLPRMGDQPFWDAGDVRCPSEAAVVPSTEESPPAGLMEQAQHDLANQVKLVHQQRSFPLVVGGGHELAWGSFQGLVSSQLDLSSILVLNLDAHLDLRPTRVPNSGTPFLQILEWSRSSNVPVHYAAIGVSRFANTRGLFQKADAYQASYVLDEQMQSETDLLRCQRLVNELLERHSAVYLSVCLDVLPGSVAPGVSAPATLGVPLGHIEQLIEQVLGSKQLLQADIAELNPSYDQDLRTARIAARLASRIAGHQHQTGNYPRRGCPA